MADPISIMAVAGLVYAGRNLGKRAEKAESVPQQDKVQVQVQKQKFKISSSSSKVQKFKFKSSIELAQPWKTRNHCRLAKRITNPHARSPTTRNDRRYVTSTLL